MPLPLSRRLILQQARGQLLTSHCLSAYGFMFYFTPYTRVLFTFPSQYYFAIGYPGVFSLTRWSSLIHTGFHVSHATRDKTFKFSFFFHFNYWTFTIFGTGFSCFVLFKKKISGEIFSPSGENFFFCLPTTPIPFTAIGLGCSRFARRYYGNRVCFLFLQLLRCFNSLGCLFPTYEFCWKLYRLPYSGISGSKFFANSPERFAGICALHRLWVPRSPP